MKNNLKKLQLTALFSLIAFSSIFSPVYWLAPVAARNTPIKFTPPPAPPDRGAAGTRSGAASRGCSSDQPMTALVPVYEETTVQASPITKVWGLTTAKLPTFWFFVPYQKASIKTMEFVVKDETSKPSQTIYRNFVTPPSAPGIINIKLPSSVKQLQVGKTYNWFLKVKVDCNQQLPAQLEYVEGWVQRVNPNSKLVSSLSGATPQQKVALYAENSIWHDALTTLAELRLDKPKDTTLMADWNGLLKSVGLENLANQPFVR
ncbi:hypothetical protein NIES4071_20720 [Calothrix sp. NIES-4071]|nr:hypothetical protein NIES4071_20720 [Calothrix sp. NIES-4071]BAZ56404.1 hypothetical protein NIES4105_20670 [Calothrix sp. NIES-4105]